MLIVWADPKTLKEFIMMLVYLQNFESLLSLVYCKLCNRNTLWGPAGPVTELNYGVPTCSVTELNYGIPTCSVTELNFGIPTCS